ncbi:MAG: ATP-dependent Clp protease ATP-binding subunit ClpX [Flavobacteriales endosymbiont of Rhyzopertha dominica]|nr:MAG: ATP-dependent Clp protease ATP-binding subunit ClpX [Candidatus Shikimatogenerans bostrichidophilus]
MKNNNLYFNTPKEIKNILDNYIVGQEETKKIVSVSIYNHYKRILYNSDKNNDKKIDKSNILIIGETGTGKTLIAKTIAKILQVPFVMVDATSFTEAGYVGEDIESILTRLLQNSKYNVNLTEKGIVYIDEFDKLSRKSKNPTITRDVSGEGVQQSLLKLLENSIIYISPYIGRKHPEQELIPINTENILFIVGGTFEGINNIINKRMKNYNIGYNIKRKNNKIYKKNLLKNINTKDLQNYGIIPEIIGRLPIIITLEKLNKKYLKKILVNNFINQYIELLKIDNIFITINNNVLNYIAKKSIKLKLGARGLRNICEKIFQYISYEEINNYKDKKNINIDEKLIFKIFKKKI